MLAGKPFHKRADYVDVLKARKTRRQWEEKIRHELEEKHPVSGAPAAAPPPVDDDAFFSPDSGDYRSLRSYSSSSSADDPAPPAPVSGVVGGEYAPLTGVFLDPAWKLPKQTPAIALQFKRLAAADEEEAEKSASKASGSASSNVKKRTSQELPAPAPTTPCDETTSMWLGTATTKKKRCTARDVDVRIDPATGELRQPAVRRKHGTTGAAASASSDPAASAAAIPAALPQDASCMRTVQRYPPSDRHLLKQLGWSPTAAAPHEEHRHYVLCNAFGSANSDRLPKTFWIDVQYDRTRDDDRRRDRKADRCFLPHT